MATIRHLLCTVQSINVTHAVKLTKYYSEHNITFDIIKKTTLNINNFLSKLIYFINLPQCQSFSLYKVEKLAAS